MKMGTKSRSHSSLTETLVEKIAEHNGFGVEDPEFCLYEETDVEAFERFLERTEGPVITELQIFDTAVTVEKGRDGEITAEVEPVVRIGASD